MTSSTGVAIRFAPGQASCQMPAGQASPACFRAWWGFLRGSPCYWEHHPVPGSLPGLSPARNHGLLFSNLILDTPPTKSIKEWDMNGTNSSITTDKSDMSSDLFLCKMPKIQLILHLAQLTKFTGPAVFQRHASFTCSSKEPCSLPPQRWQSSWGDPSAKEDLNCRNRTWGLNLKICNKNSMV